MLNGCHSIFVLFVVVAITDHGPPSSEDIVSAQRAGASQATTGRSQSRRADAVQVRREAIPRPLLRQQAQLVRITVETVGNKSATFTP